MHMQVAMLVAHTYYVITQPQYKSPNYALQSIGDDHMLLKYFRSKHIQIVRRSVPRDQEQHENHEETVCWIEVIPERREDEADSAVQHRHHAVHYLNVSAM